MCHMMQLRRALPCPAMAHHGAAVPYMAGLLAVSASLWMPVDASHQHLLAIALADGRSGALHPMLRNLTDAAPQLGDAAAFRSGRAAALPDDENTQQFRAQANRAMGSDEADRPFGGEVAVESQVGLLGCGCCCVGGVGCMPLLNTVHACMRTCLIHVNMC
jgi:hypothetical protein